MATKASTLTPLEDPQSATRRLSYVNLKTNDIAFGKSPAVVLPPNKVDRPGEASEVASAMDLARQTLEGLTTAEVCAKPPSSTKTTDRYAFAFDIDGVLIKGGQPIPEALEAMKMLNGQNNRGIKV